MSKTNIGYHPHIFPNGTLKPHAKAANREHRQRMESGNYCLTCGCKYGSLQPTTKREVIRDTAKPDICTACVKDLG